MSLIISFYSSTAFQEYILPSVNNADYMLTVRSNDFQLKKDLHLYMEVLGDKWCIRRTSRYQVSKDNVRYERRVLQHNDVLQLITSHQEQITVIVQEVPSAFHAYRKFMLGEISSLTIGKDTANDICYDFLGMVSRSHAKITYSGNGYTIENLSQNGIYVNSRRIDQSAVLQFGDFINIMGLHMVFLGTMLAIDMGNRVFVQSAELIPYTEGSMPEIYKEIIPRAMDTPLYHRAPRNYEKLGEGTIEIEAPPQKNMQKKQSLFMAAGPSVTMALPMILGCVLMMGSYRGNGAGTNSLYMYSGLMMSVSSALVAVIWAVININAQKREVREQEQHRMEAYSDYLVEKSEEIKSVYQETERRLKVTYPDADTCLGYNENKGMLWNRNYAHDDFLKHRLGMGNVPFQYAIKVPKKKFELFRDELAEKPGNIQTKFSMLYDVPVTVDLLEKKLIGVIGGNTTQGAIEIVKNLALQIAANNCYTDVKMGFIYNEESSNDFGKWDFAKWLPHVWAEQNKTRLVASNKEEASEVFYELTKIFRLRQTEQDERKQTTPIPKPYYIIFISDVSFLEGELFAKYVYEQDKACGLTTILLADYHEKLPNDCEFIIENTNTFQGMYEVYAPQDCRREIKFDMINSDKLDAFSRHISSLRVPETETGGELASAITFFEMLGVNRIEEYPVIENWAKNRTYENIRGMLGEKSGGVPCYLDVHEKYHGPHGLVAGTTGSGKSETLQSYMLSLAVNYSPDDVAFFIIDYKGGGMANLFDGLPHMIGQISNLSGNQVKRAMISIKSENRRRQRVFSEHGVNNINLYTKLYKNGEARMPVPHLFIIIDEFAELKREEPDFMRELISVAQVGRSLGVHLILATQKPSGTVDDNIWSNSKFRLCLRVQDQQDSKDMLHKPDAAYITQPGRGYLQVGSDEVYELFQSGYSGAVYDENMTVGNTDIAKLITLPGKVDMTGNSVKRSLKRRSELAWIDKLCECIQRVESAQGNRIRQCTDIAQQIQLYVENLYYEFDDEDSEFEYPESDYNTARLIDLMQCYMEAMAQGNGTNLSALILNIAEHSGRRLPQAKEKTQLDAVKEYLAKVAEENAYHHKISLWMPVLRETIYLDEFEEFNQNCYQWGEWFVPEGTQSLRVVLGQMDDPENQNQMPLTLDILESGNVVVCGNIVCGKSTLMQTMMYALIHKYTPQYVNMYCIDFSNKMMSAFEAAPHIGGVMLENDFDKIDKFFNMLQDILAERKRLLQGGDYKQFIQVNGMQLPAIIIFIDNYAAFKEKTQEQYEDLMIQLSKEGVSNGIYFVISGAGFGINEISNRIGENMQTVLCLSLKDRFAYADMLHTISVDVLPENGIKGRGLAYYGERILEFQTALAFRAANNYIRMEMIKTECKGMRDAWNAKEAREIPEIPEKPVWSHFVRLDGFQELLQSRDYIPVGYNQANARIYGVPLYDIYCYLICGGARTGKTNFLRVFVQSAITKQSDVCLIDSPEGGLKAYQNYESIVYATNEQEIFTFFKEELTPVFKERNVVKNQLLNAGRDEMEIYVEMAKRKPYFIFISDLSWFVRIVYESEYDMRSFLETLIAKGRWHNIYFVAELPLSKVSEIKGYQVFDSMAEYGTGIHFGGKVDDNPVLSFEHLSYAEQSVSEKAGVGMLPNVTDKKDTARIVVPLARK